MPRLIGRAAAAASVIASFALTAPAQAHHIQTCPGFNEPACNVEYFKAHQVDPHTSPIEREVNRLVKCLTAGSVVYCVTSRVDGALEDVDEVRSQVYELKAPYTAAVYEQVDSAYDTVYPIVDPVVDQAEATAKAALCHYFGACN